MELGTYSTTHASFVATFVSDVMTCVNDILPICLELWYQSCCMLQVSLLVLMVGNLLNVPDYISYDMLQ
jgi:hypothetical protein